jgi:hypothetical protein
VIADPTVGNGHMASVLPVVRLGGVVRFHVGTRG